MAALLGCWHTVKRVRGRLAIAINPWIAKVITSLASVVHMPRVVLPGRGEGPGQVGDEEVLDPANEDLEGNRLKIVLCRIPHLIIGGSTTLIFDLPAGPHQT